jgi:hypothetical protein
MDVTPGRASRRRWGRGMLLLAAGFALGGKRRLAAATEAATVRPVGSGQASGPALGLVPGERQIYRLRWGIFHVGQAELTIGDEPEVVPGGNGKGYPLTFSVTSAGIAERLYRVRTQIISWLPQEADRSLGYRKLQDEGGRKRDEVITFDRAGGVARYTNFGKPGGEVEVPEDVHDPLSVLFAVRYGPPLLAGERRAIPVTDGRRLVDVDVHVVGQETVGVPAGRFQAWRLEPETGDLGGVFQRSRNSRLEVWLADDPVRTPIQMRGSVRVGTFAGELVTRG